LGRGLPGLIIVSLVPTNSDVVLATINPDFLAFAIRKFFVSIPKNLISAMNAFVVSFLFNVSGDFLWHKFYFPFARASRNASSKIS
jgi:hypothetical protein